MTLLRPLLPFKEKNYVIGWVHLVFDPGFLVFVGELLFFSGSGWKKSDIGNAAGSFRKNYKSGIPDYSIK